MSDLIDRQTAIDAIIEDKICDDSLKIMTALGEGDKAETLNMTCDRHAKMLMSLPPAQPERRYTEEELKVFQNGISLSLLSKRSSQHWRYDEDTATEIKFLEQLHEKVSADMRGETT